MNDLNSTFGKSLKILQTGHKVPEISWGNDFNEFDDARKIRFLKKLASSMNHAADLMQKERDQLLVDVKKLTDLNTAAATALTIQKNIVATHLKSSNERNQKLSTQIQDLQSQVRTRDKALAALREGAQLRASL